LANDAPFTTVGAGAAVVGPAVVDEAVVDEAVVAGLTGTVTVGVDDGAAVADGVGVTMPAGAATFAVAPVSVLAKA
jgi:hypothetical protein